MQMLKKLSVWLVFLVALLMLPQIFDSILAISILNQMAIAIVFALSYNMLLGQGGMLSFGHAVYFGLGGFMAVHALYHDRIRNCLLFSGADSPDRWSVSDCWRQFLSAASPPAKQAPYLP